MTILNSRASLPDIEVAKCNNRRVLSLRPQYLATLAAAIFSLCIGLVIGWMSPTISKLKAGKGPFIYDDDYDPLLGNAKNYGAIVGSVIGAIIGNLIGRKFSLLLAAVPFVTSAMMIYFGTSIMSYVISRFISGCGCGLVYSVLAVYCGEIASASIRGHLISLLAVFHTLGVTVEFAVAPLVTIQQNAIVLGVIPMIGFIALAFMPETPYFYIMIGKDKLARKSLNYLHRNEEEAVKIKEFQEQNKIGTVWNLISSKRNIKAFYLAFLVQATLPISGVIAFTTFASVIFEDNASIISEYWSQLIFILSSLISAITFGRPIDKYGRRPLLLTSCTLTVLVLFIIGSYYYVRKVTPSSTFAKISMFPLIGLVILKVVVGIGIQSLDRVMAGELFATNIRSAGNSLLAILISLVGSLMTDMFHVLHKSNGLEMVFWFFSVALLVITSLVFFFVPETKGKTLEQIQQDLDSNSSNAEK